MKYLLNGSKRKFTYYCADRIDPKWDLGFHTIPYQIDVEKKIVAKQQDGLRKDLKKPLAY
jgi:Plant transposon protein